MILNADVDELINLRKSSAAFQNDASPTTPKFGNICDPDAKAKELQSCDNSVETESETRSN